jgi:SMP-30/gluconolaconase/LRE-like protein
MSLSIGHPLRRMVGLAALAVVASCKSNGTRVATRDSSVDAEARDSSGAWRVGAVDGFRQPESVKYDSAEDVFYVSNMYGEGSTKDGIGYIARFNAADLGDMRIVVEGGRNGATLDAPKGLALHGDTLWTADIDVLRAFDKHTGAPLAAIDLRPYRAVLLNDLDVGPDGSLHVTDTGIIMSDKGVLYPRGDKIFVIGPGRSVSIVAQGDSLHLPNGITWDGSRKRWIVVSFDPFHSEVYVPHGDSARTVLGSGKGRFDGVEVLADGTILVTCWTDSSVHAFGDGRDTKIVRNLPMAADLGLDTRRNRVAVPLVNRGRVEIWSLPRQAGNTRVVARGDTLLPVH